ncbi:MAG TPA: coproporphyrinogen dehydrogenase HemZ [Syntrophomonadaceae bacterium]|nr:coproporphyrinogen dehydrogenase HemZ [Syntrophomonadaceae bacterium]
MLISCDLEPESLYVVVHDLIRLTFPGSILVKGDNDKAEINIQIKMLRYDGIIKLIGKVREVNNTSQFDDEYSIEIGEDRKAINRRIRRFCFKLLSKHQNKPISSYGTLTGVKPVKMIHRFLDEEYSREAMKSILQKDRYLQTEKIDLLTEVAFNNRKYLLNKEMARKLVSIYIGIPYCPTRCYYCSFPSAVLKDYDQEILPFLKTLLTEIKLIGNYLKSQDIKVQTIYIGGGTPTILKDKDMSTLLETVNINLKSDQTKEITVEAGRPDTLSLAKIQILKDGGVTRICINPQTMNDKTLQVIGRKHSVKEVINAVELARQVGINQLSMDVIVGFPGEKEEEYAQTAESIIKIKPENLTIHTLALKKGAKMAENDGRINMEMRISRVEEGAKYFSNILRKANYIPYYLYRQKYMRGDMENIGFSQPGNICIYNIQMIEERQSIIGLGGGGASKFVKPDNWSLTSIYNPKDPKAYIKSMPDLLARKVDKLMGLN